MRGWFRALAIGVIAVANLGAAAAQSPGPVLDGISSPLPEAERTEVLVLASPHLGILGSQFRPGLLDSLVAVLAAWKPDAIAVERMPGELVESLEGQHRTAFAAAVEDRRVELGHWARLHTGQSRYAAWSKAHRTVRNAAPGGVIVDAERITLIVDLLAAYDLSSAVLQWGYLSDSTRSSTTALPRWVKSVMEERRSAISEDVALGHRLARSLGLQAILDVDDLEYEMMVHEHLPDLDAALFASTPQLSAAGKAPVYRAFTENLLSSVAAGDLLPTYRLLNGAEFQRDDVDAQWLVWHRTNLPSGSDRRRLGMWEARNLSIATRIRRAMATSVSPGGRLLVIIGAAHKPFLDAYLAQQFDLRLAQLETLLGK